MELESRPLSRLKVACWKGRRVDIFHFYFRRIYFFAFPALPNDIKVSSASVESWCIRQVMPKTAICFETQAEIRGQDVFLKSASLVRAKLRCWVSKIPGSHLLKEYSSRHIFLKLVRKIARISQEASGLFSLIQSKSHGKVWIIILGVMDVFFSGQSYCTVIDVL